MKKYIQIFILIFFISNIYSFSPFDGEKPVIVLIQTDPWKMVIGSDTPFLAVYESGRIIYYKVVKNNL